VTWSLIARDVSAAFGVALASRFFAVGGLCPHAESGAGAPGRIAVSGAVARAIL